MPVFFYIDPEFATDARLRGVDQLTLSYTFFKAEPRQGPGRVSAKRCMWRSRVVFSFPCVWRGVQCVDSKGAAKAVCRCVSDTAGDPDISGEDRQVRTG
jgi:hypothetical protein